MKKSLTLTIPPHGKLYPKPARTTTISPKRWDAIIAPFLARARMVAPGSVDELNFQWLDADDWYPVATLGLDVTGILSQRELIAILAILQEAEREIWGELEPPEGAA